MDVGTAATVRVPAAIQRTVEQERMTEAFTIERHEDGVVVLPHTKTSNIEIARLLPCVRLV
jgi:hypothetical protein